MEIRDERLTRTKVKLGSLSKGQAFMDKKGGAFRVLAFNRNIYMQVASEEYKGYVIEYGCPLVLVDNLTYDSIGFMHESEMVTPVDAVITIS